MSYAIIRQLLEARLASTPNLPTTFYENAQGQVVNPSVPHLRVFLLPGDTEQPTMGGLAGSGIALQREAGVLQVTLYYPANAGPGASVAQAEILRARFPRGLVLTSGSVRVTVERAPSIAPAFNDGGFYGTPLSIPFRADVFS